MNKSVSKIMILAMAGSFMAGIPALAATSQNYNRQMPSYNRAGNFGNGQARGFSGMNRGQMRLSVIGTVSAVNGNTIAVSGRQGFGTTTAATIFTVDATNAKVTKNNATSTVSSIAVNDNVVVQGKVSGTNIVATMIRDGNMGFGGQNNRMGVPNRVNGPNRMATSTQIEGNGQPVVAGTVSAINGSTLSIANKSNAAYTVDGSGAKVLRGQNAISLSDVKVGDAVMVQGVVNGTSVSASTIIDQAKPVNANPVPANAKQQPRSGILNQIGQFFTHLFGF